MYWQARWIFDRPYNAYIVFDTLTYAPEYLPRLSRYFDVDKSVDFSIVDYDDIQKFLKRLRMNLWRHYRVDKGKLKYFIASEYGHDDIYKDDYGVEHKGTTRPHYHCLFYVDVDASELSPMEFVKEVHYSWQNGNTDNYKSFKVRMPHYGSRLRNNVFGKIFWRKSDNDLRRITNYVSKYIRKSDEYEDLVNKRVYSAFMNYVEKLPKEIKTDTITSDSIREAMWLRKFYKNNRSETIPITYSEKEIYKIIRDDIKSKIRVFHKQSQGFGYYAIPCLSEEDKNYMIRSGNMRLADESQVVREIPVPMYYIRKLFYNYRVSSDGRVQWYLTDNGLSCMKQMTYGKIKRLGDRYNEWFLNLSNERFSDVFNYDLVDEDVKDMILDLLDGRDFYDLATYSICYRGRILYQYHTSSDNMPSIDDILEMQNDYNIDISEKYYMKGEGQVSYYDEDDLLPWNGKSVHRKYKDFYRIYCINENTEFENEKRFRDFDFLLDIIRWTQAPKMDEKQKTMRGIVDLRERLKDYGFHVKN